MYCRFEIEKESAFKWRVLHFSSPTQENGRWVATFKTEEAAKKYIIYLQR